jgi:integrase
MLLTSEKVDTLKVEAGKADRFVWDDKVSGFGVRVHSGGKKTWIIQYRIGKRQRRLSLGSVDKMSADKARSEAKIKLGKAEDGIDPAIERAERVEAAQITFGRQIDAFLDHAKENVRPRTLDELDRHLNEHWKPFHALPLEGIRRENVSAQLIVIKKERGPIAANRAHATLSNFFGWAMHQGLTEHNPVIGTKKPVKEKARDRVLNAGELVAIWNAAPPSQVRRTGDEDYGRIVQLLILTGQRRTEIGDMARPEIDPDKRVFSMGAARTKNGRPHDVPLSNGAMAIIAQVEEREDRDFLFGRGQGGFSGWGRAKADLDDRIRKAATARDPKAKLVPWTLHDIRRTVATGMADLGVQPHVVEAVLNHVSGHKAGVAGIYNRAAYTAEKRQALDMWGARVAALVAGKARDNIVTLRKG